MKPLTPQQEKFARLVAEGNNQSQAYRQAYPNALEWKQESVAVAGAKLMAIDNVSQMVDALRAESSKKAVLTLDSHIAELERLKNLALEAGKFEAAIGAEVHRGKAVGLYVSKTEDVTDPMRKALGKMKPEKLESVVEALEQVQAIRHKAKSAALPDER